MLSKHALAPARTASGRVSVQSLRVRNLADLSQHQVFLLELGVENALAPPPTLTKWDSEAFSLFPGCVTAIALVVLYTLYLVFSGSIEMYEVG